MTRPTRPSSTTGPPTASYDAKGSIAAFTDAAFTDAVSGKRFDRPGLTELLRNGGDLEVAARIAGHESTRTTQLYNRLREEISLDEIERIHI